MLTDLIRKSIDSALKQLGLQGVEYTVERAADARFGDLATNVALKAAKNSLGKGQQSPLAIARLIVDKLGDLPFARQVNIVKPGFINITLSPKWVNLNYWGEAGSPRYAGGAGDDQGRTGNVRKVQVEYVSANPTGPLHIGNARSGPVGDSLARVLKFLGHTVEREYYVNDIGGQVEKLGESMFKLGYPKRLGKSGEDGEKLEYRGEFYKGLAQQVRENLEKERGKQAIEELPDVELTKLCAQKAVELNLASIKRDCQDLGCEFDVWVKESDIASKTPVVIEGLKQKGQTLEKDAALWLKGQAEDRDSVLVRRDGQNTYFANDIAYHLDKFNRGFDLVIDVWGSNHHGHVPRVKAGVKALGIDPERLKIILYQFVRVKRGNEVARMSKRLGTFVTAREVLDEVGADATRFFLLHRSPETHLDFDLELAKSKSEDNPVYAAQYAHARMCSILRKAGEENRGDWGNKGNQGGAKNDQGRTGDVLEHPAELKLMKKIMEFPEVVDSVARNFSVHLLTYYSMELAKLFHQFYEQCRVLSDNARETEARLRLVSASKAVLAKTLELIGVSAPEKMER